MSTGERPADGLEALQREAKANSQMETYNTVARAVHWLYAQALGEHIAVAKEREEKVASLLEWAKAALKAEFSDLDAADLAPGTYWAKLQSAIRALERVP
jgi:hypothetical protein